jgi:hypothetical protein
MAKFNLITSTDVNVDLHNFNIPSDTSSIPSLISDDTSNSTDYSSVPSLISSDTNSTMSIDSVPSLISSDTDSSMSIDDNTDNLSSLNPSDISADDYIDNFSPLQFNDINNFDGGINNNFNYINSKFYKSDKYIKYNNSTLLDWLEYMNAFPPYLHSNKLAAHAFMDLVIKISKWEMAAQDRAAKALSPYTIYDLLRFELGKQAAKLKNAMYFHELPGNCYEEFYSYFHKLPGNIYAEFYLFNYYSELLDDIYAEFYMVPERKFINYFQELPRNIYAEFYGDSKFHTVFDDNIILTVNKTCIIFNFNINSMLNTDAVLTVMSIVVFHKINYDNNL